MKKKLIILLILFLNIFIYPILRPNKNKEVGAIIGRIFIKMGNSWDINLYLKNNKTGRDYIIKPKDIKYSTLMKKHEDSNYSYLRNSRYYILLNLEPGSYSLNKFGLSRSTSTHYYWASGLDLAKGGINIIVEPNKITPINYLEFNIGYDRYEIYKDNIDVNEYINDLKEYFMELDKKGFWKDFEWKELKTGNDLVTEKM